MDWNKSRLHWMASAGLGTGLIPIRISASQQHALEDSSWGELKARSAAPLPMNIIARFPFMPTDPEVDPLVRRRR